MSAGTDVTLNGPALRNRRQELGLSERKLAALLGAGFSFTIIRSLEAGTHDDDLTLGAIRRLAQTLDLSPSDLLTTPAPTPVPPMTGPPTAGDALASAVQRASALLYELDRPLPEQVLAELLEVDMEQLEPVLAALNAAAALLGLRVRRVAGGTSLVAREGIVAPGLLQESWRRHLGRTGLDRGQAFALARVVRGDLGQNLPNDTRTRLASLANAGVITRTTPGGFDLSERVRFSLAHEVGEK